MKILRFLQIFLQKLTNFCGFGLKVIRIYENFEKMYTFYSRNFQWKIVFCPFFLPFSRVLEPVGEFFAFNFFPFAVWVGGGFFRLVWTSGESEEKGGLNSCFKIKFLIFFFIFILVMKCTMT